MVDLEIVKKHGKFLNGQYVRFIDEFQKDKILAIMENSGTGVIIDRNNGPPVDFRFNKYDKLNILSVKKLPRCPNHYLIKHRAGIKIINPDLKRWYDVSFE